MSRRHAKEKAIETLAKVGLSADVAELLPVELSGGMQKRVGLARAMFADPAFDGDPAFCALLSPRQGGGEWTIELGCTTTSTSS